MTFALAAIVSALGICVRAQFVDRTTCDDTYIRIEKGEWL